MGITTNPVFLVIFASQSFGMKNALLLVLLIASFRLTAQDNYVFSPINSNDGLSDNRVRNISQLPDGRMVIITEGLVNLYDGARFRYIHYDDRKAYRLANYTGWHHTYIDGDKRMWVKNHKKLFIFDLRKELFIPNVDSIFTAEGVNHVVSDLFMDTEQNFWYLTQNDDLYYRKNGTVKTTLFLSRVTDIGRLNDQLYNLVVCQNQVYLFYKSGRLICYNRLTRKQEYIEDPFSGNNNYTSSLEVALFGNYIYQLRSGNDIGSVLRFNVTNRMWEQVLETDYGLNTLSVDKKGDCWISSLAGLWVVDKNLRKKRLMSPFHLVDGRIVEAEIGTQYNDDKGGLWVGTIDRGVLYYHPDRFKFRNIGRSLFAISSTKKISVRSFAEKDGYILVGTQNGLFRYKRESPTVEQDRSIPTNAICEKLFKDSKKRLWLCTQNYGLYCFVNNRITHYNVPVYCLNLFETSDNRLYLCTNKGIGLFDPNTGTYKNMPQDPNHPITYTYQLTTFDKDVLLGYSDEGLFLFNYRTNTYSFPKKESILLQHNCHEYHCLFTDSRGLIWLGTMDGLTVFNPANGSATGFSEKEGLINNSIRSVMEDNAGNMWVSTSNGISRIDIQEKNGQYSYTLYNYNRYDGVIETEFLPRSVLKTSYNSMLWGGLDGFNEINLDRITLSEQPLSVPLITNLLLFGTEVRQQVSYDGNTILTQSISSTQKIQLTYSQNFVGFEFSALNYVNPTQTFYRYKLEGADISWNEIQSTDGVGRANYTNLSPGTYHLQVYAANNSRSWGNRCAELTVVIKPPFWQTPFAYAMYFLLFLCLLYVCISYYNKWNKLKMEKKQKADLEQLKYAFFTNISHELRTPLTLILTPLDSIIQKIEEGTLKKQLNGIYRNADELLRLVNQLLDFRKLEMKGETLELSYCNLSDALDVIANSFKEMAANKNIAFSFDCSDHAIYAFVDTDKLQKIVNNLLSNAMKFTPSGGKITVGLFYDPHEQTITLNVSDTGIGIPEVEVSQIFDRFYQVKKQKDTNTGSGIGLHLVKEYVTLHKGTIEVASRLNEGSTFTVKLPTNLQLEEDDSLDSEQKTKEARLSLLVVEDNVEFRTFLQTEFSEAYRVVVASNGKEGLEKALSTQPDLVITDVMMPEMSGTDLCRRLKKDIRTSHIPVILLTAKTSDKAQIEGFEAGADAYISKPFNMNILSLRIQHLIEQQDQRKQLFKNAVIINPEVLTSTNVDKGLIQDALKFIEKNIDNVSYSVEQLSKDLCMDRTGLYRKLSAIVGQTPSEFIRSVRLKNAAQLLLQGLTVSEVAGRVGFGTTSYFTKCFQDEFGIKPSQYKHSDRQ